MLLIWPIAWLTGAHFSRRVAAARLGRAVEALWPGHGVGMGAMPMRDEPCEQGPRELRDDVAQGELGVRTEREAEAHWP